MWSRLALLAAGAIVGGAATRVASDPAAREALGRRLQTGTAVARTAPGDVERRPVSGGVELLRTTARRFGEFAARVRAGMDEREAQLREQFGVRTPVDHTANHPGAAHPTAHDAAVPPAGAPWRSVTPHQSTSAPEDPRGTVVDHVPSEGNER
ncbi:hypothetical protein [Kocuria sp.]|uniref:hypothetical protein n=1 Tax=Kocuria sp. TaxID=1871328 RepID=UPI0026DB1339|nr:hypothetical protein [Kocuria sp.]MDO4919458.1 hypothetical protein [Kocuria sp.]